MKTLFVGGGQGCLGVLDLVEQGRLAFLGIEVAAVVDPDPRAPALCYAQRRGWPTLDRIEDGIDLEGIELVVELTGSNDVLDQIHQHVPHGVRVIDHVLARVFWDLERVASDLRQELHSRTELQSRVSLDRAQLQDILDAIPDLIVVLDQWTRIVRVNQRFERITGLFRDTVLGQRIEEVFERPGDEDWSGEFARLFDNVTSDGTPVSIVSRKRLRSSRIGHFMITANPIFDEDLEIARVVVSAREITEQVRLRRETEESARNFQQIVDSVHGLVTIKDLEGRYMVVNPWTAKVVGIPREEMIGKTAHDLFPPDAAEQIHRLDRETLEQKERHVSEEIISIDGVAHVLVSERLPLTDYKGQVVAICCVSQDHTRRRELQHELVQNERLAAIGKLSAGVAHEINNPLSGVLTFAQDLLEQAEPDDPLRPDYELIVNETLRCRRIVRELLEFSRQRKPRRQPTKLRDIIAPVRIMLERQASFQNIEFDVQLDDDLPALYADPNQIQQVLLNLAINARDALNAEGTVSIRGETANQGRAVLLTVSDRGCGMSEEQLGQIFEPFQSTKGEQGHGLGLTAVQSIVERHAGRIEVESRVGEGTVFRVTLPSVLES